MQTELVSTNTNGILDVADIQISGKTILLPVEKQLIIKPELISTNGDRAARSAGSGICRRPNDFYATPEKLTEKVIEEETLFGTVMEPAVGLGHMARVLRRYEHPHYGKLKVISSDKYERVPVLKDGVKLPNKEEAKKISDEEYAKFFNWVPIDEQSFMMDFLQK